MTQDHSTRSIVEHEGGHLRVLGPAASGKTTLMLERFRWLEGQGRRPAIIAYGREHRDRLVEALVPDGSARFGRVPVWTFPQLANELLRIEHPAARGALGELEEHVLLERVIEEAPLRSDYRNIIGSDTLRSTLLSVIHVLLQNDVPPDADPQGDDRLADILLLYREYRDRLARSGDCTFYDVTWRAARSLQDRRGDHPVFEADVLLVDDFNDIDAGQFALLLQLAPPGGSVEVNAFGDPAGARFRFRGTSEAFLDRYFPERYAPADRALEGGAFPVPAPSRSPAPGDAQLGLFDASAQPSDGVVLSGAVVAEDEIAEARWVVDTVRGLLDGGVDPAGIAVVVREAHRFRLPLERAFADAGIRFDSGVERPGPVERLVLGLMRGLGSREVDAAEVLRDSPLYRRAFDAFAPALELGSCRRTPGEAGRIAGHIRRSSFAAGRRFSMSRFMACMETVFDGAPTGERKAIDALRDDWYGYARMTEQLGGSASPSGFLRLRRMRGARPSVTRGDAVRLFTAREASGRSFEAVVLAGCAEGVFPMIESSPAYVPWARVERLLSAGAFPVKLQGNRARDLLLEDERALLEATMRRAKRYLFVSAPEKIDGEPVVAPSGPLRALFESAGASRVPRRDGLFERSARAVVRGRGSLSPELTGAGRVERLWLADRPPVREFALEPFALSASRLGALDECERRFFYQRVLKMDTEESVPLQFGKWLHELLEGLIEVGEDGNALRARLGPDGIDALAGAMADRVEEGAVMAASMRTHAAAVLEGLREMEDRRTPVARFEASEWMFEFEEEGFRFNGRADRVDRLAGGGLVVVDYKTGKMLASAKGIRGRIVDPDRVEGRDWQVALYSRAVEHEYGKPPQSFCYYQLAPGKKPDAVELRIAEGGPGSAAFEEIKKTRVGAVSEPEVSAVIDRGVMLSRRAFAPRVRFERTEVTKRCGGCLFKRVCERDE